MTYDADLWPLRLKAIDPIVYHRIYTETWGITEQALTMNRYLDFSMISFPMLETKKRGPIKLRYYKRVEDIQLGRVGRQISAANHQSAISQLHNSEHLYVMCDTSSYHIAACVDSKSEYDEALRMYIDRKYQTFQLFALPEDEHRQTQ